MCWPSLTLHQFRPAHSRIRCHVVIGSLINWIYWIQLHSATDHLTDQALIKAFKLILSGSAAMESICWKMDRALSLQDSCVDQRTQKISKVPVPSIPLPSWISPRQMTINRAAICGIFSSKMQHTIATANAMTSGTSADLLGTLRGSPESSASWAASMGGTCQDWGRWPVLMAARILCSSQMRIAAIPNAHQASLNAQQAKPQLHPTSPGHIRMATSCVCVCWTLGRPMRCLTCSPLQGALFLSYFGWHKAMCPVNQHIWVS